MIGFRIGDRVVVTDWGCGDECGQEGVVVTEPYRSPLTGRVMVDVRLDGRQPHEDVGYYLSQIDPVQHSVRVA